MGVASPKSADGRALIHDVAGLAQAGPLHLAFFDGGRAKHDFIGTKAGWCLVREKEPPTEVPRTTILLSCSSVPHAFAAAADLFYPEHGLGISAQDKAIHPSARLDEGVALSPGVVVGPGAEIGSRTRIGANTVIGRGVTIGRDAEIDANVSIGYAHVGDDVVILSGARIGTPGFGFASGSGGHTKMPQLGRVIIQDGVEIGANSTVDRGALGDTVVGEGTKIDNLVQVGHNCVFGRHCIVAGGAGISGSVTIGDFVIIGGAAGIADHATIGSGARIAAMSGVANSLPGGQDYMGYLARPVREWRKEQVTLSRLAKSRRRTTSDE